MDIGDYLRRYLQLSFPGYQDIEERYKRVNFYRSNRLEEMRRWDMSEEPVDPAHGQIYVCSGSDAEEVLANIRHTDIYFMPPHPDLSMLLLRLMLFETPSSEGPLPPHRHIVIFCTARPLSTRSFGVTGIWIPLIDALVLDVRGTPTAQLRRARVGVANPH
ncbi:hypothetical protein PUNSTDRAFT_138698 [Punctularia strigosozonata HHB-11173 SS5]|uniref:Uncharacterized protein n=1 Tax=Punctularia strigosozonata (strain HHB-11173) TaxID=741275 RepID=R7S282_PUNST|nr:uncharacterized protein PUNSTDRAFT_138698 [Punctularia strigosozonata HHB-11173 SS5]EIN04303.1 hypothetical protein PUNSTDRAFT_138698 [Punctularia strigosozonata HHB-11173 SS5]